jgi:hypothetical protein
MFEVGSSLGEAIGEAEIFSSYRVGSFFARLHDDFHARLHSLRAVAHMESGKHMDKHKARTRANGVPG